MRLWHYKLIPYLPKSQLIAQWRELNSIYKNQPKHILINYVYEYPKANLAYYSALVINELDNRGYKINLNNFSKYITRKDFLLSTNFDDGDNPFPQHHTDRYLKQCFYNLQEKFDRGQKDFSKKQYYKLWEFAITKTGLVEYLNKKEY